MASPKLKSTVLAIHDIEEDAIIINVEGWRMRVYLDENFKGKIGKGMSIEVQYYGDIQNPHGLKFEKLK